MGAGDDGVGEGGELVEFGVGGLDEIRRVVGLVAKVAKFVELCPFRPVEEFDGEGVVDDCDVRCGTVGEAEPACSGDCGGRESS